MNTSTLANAALFKVAVSEVSAGLSLLGNEYRGEAERLAAAAPNVGLGGLAVGGLAGATLGGLTGLAAPEKKKGRTALRNALIGASILAPALGALGYAGTAGEAKGWGDAGKANQLVAANPEALAEAIAESQAPAE